MIYFIQEAGNNKAAIKIGYTSGKPEHRLASLQTGYPARLVLLHAQDGRPEDEKRLHGMWKHIRLHGEWFKATPELLGFIGSKNDETPTAQPITETEPEPEEPPEGPCPSLRLDYLRQERHRTQLEALGVLSFLFRDYAPFKPLTERRKCPRCWKWCWMFEAKEDLFVVWDGWPPAAPDGLDGSFPLSCVDLFSVSSRERAFRPRAGCGYDFPGRRLAL